jgi:hypothetical protein
MRAVLVVSEVALACVLLVGAGLLLRSFPRVLDVDLGFQPSRAAAIKIDYNDGGKAERRGCDPARHSAPRVRNSGYSVERHRGYAAARPQSKLGPAGEGQGLPQGRSWRGLRLYRDARILGRHRHAITRGPRLQLAGDMPTSERVVVINQAAAGYHWPGEDPVGRTALVNGRDTRVIGVISDVRESSVEEGSGLEMYLPETQADPEGAELVVRSQVSPAAQASGLMRTLRAYNPEQPAAEFRPIQSIVDHAVSPRRFFAMLVAIFAGLGLLRLPSASMA